MLTFEEYFNREGSIYRRSDEIHIDSSCKYNLTELLSYLGAVDYNHVWIEAEYDTNNVNVSFRKPEGDEEFEERKVELYARYVRADDDWQQREIEEYKRLKLKYEGGTQ